MADQMFKKKLLPCLISVALGGVVALPAMADDAAEAGANTEVEVIEVRGIRDSLKRNLADKRDSDAIIDVVHSEDIGKFPDKNVAESLQRISGVTVQRQFGEGNGVSIRGAGVDLTLTTLNGQNVASTGWFVFQPAKRSFNYELLPSELVGSLEVYKSSQADLLEGGVGGSVNVKTRKPLDLKANTVYGSVEFTDQSDSGEMDPQFSGMYSWRNEARSVGFLFSIVEQQRSLQRQGNEAFWQWGAGPVGFEQERNRSAITGALQFAPKDNLDLSLNLMQMEMEADNTNYALWLTQADTTWGSGVTEQFLEGTPVKGPLNVAYYQMRPREATMKSDVIDFDLTYSGESFTFDAQIGKTESSGGTDFEVVVDESTGGIPINGGTYDFTGGHQTWNLGNGIGAGGATYSNYVPPGLTMGTGGNFNKTPKEDEEQYIQADLTFDVEYGAVTSIKTGVRMSEHETRSTRVLFLQDPSFNTTLPTSGLGTSLIDVGAGSYQITRFDPEAIKAWARSSIIGEQEDLGSHSEILEDNMSVYVMANYSTENAKGNFGLRYVTTDATAVYYAPQATTSSKASADYDEFLPSFNLRLNLADNVIFRTSAARVMARPDYVDMYVNPNLTGVNDDLPNNQRWIVGNVGLKPFVANQFDFGVEWYFDDNSYFSAGVFFKDVKNFVTFTDRAPLPGETPFNFDSAHTCTAPTVCESTVGFIVQEKQNGEDAEISGYELQFQKGFDNGFGTIINYTYTDTSTSEDTFVDRNPYLSDSSRHATNLIGYYENEIFSVRLAYNWRSEYMLREVGAYGNRLHDDYGTLDMSAVWHVTDYLDVKFSANNLTEESSVQKGNNNFYSNYTGFTRGFPLYEYEMARIFSIGASVRF